MSYVVKNGDEYLSTGRVYDIWTTKQKEAMRFDHWVHAFDTAEAWRSGAGAKPNVRVVKLAAPRPPLEPTTEPGHS